ncbi:MAG: Multifunctional non-homologous end joining DNA repair protein LigD [Acidimicrobiales bacterium]|nr:MAG: DNA ligase [Actinomycetota bacterium]MBV6507473.1 Multifunctional non-homologous end joining DNA repair protein LigD [Acidimicrobiales bacterium]RIK07851.1 MAG: DNA ligase [Acidobacteriota bacterium]
MKAMTGDLPTRPEEWAFEIKWDGMRAIATVVDGAVTFTSTNLIDVTASFPELAKLADALGGREAVLDGEIVAFDDDGRPSFSAVQYRMHQPDPLVATHRAAEVPVVYIAFDLLWFDGLDAMSLPYTYRRKLLAELLEDGPNWQAPDYVVGKGEQLLEAARMRDLEGVVAKRLDSTYQPGRRAQTWRKIKIRHQQELVVGGWIPGHGRSRHLGSLMVGYFDEARAVGPLRWAGNVGSGFSNRDLRLLGTLLRDLETPGCPFDPVPAGRFATGARYVRPELVIEVAFSEWTPGGRLRHPSFLGLRSDKRPEEVVREVSPTRRSST